MRIERFVAASVVALFCCATAQAAAPPLPAVVAKAVKDTAAVCTEVGGKADTTNAIKRADLNGDGIEDYVLDVGSVNCDGAASIYGDRSLVWNAKTRKFDYAPVSTVKMVL